jgi:hypothetical protein
MYKNTTIMQKNVFLFLALLFNTALSYAQDFEWSTSGGYVGITNSYNGAFDMARDKNGNIFLFNDANLAQQCQGDTVQMLSPSNPTHTFVYKFDTAGVLQWAKAIGVYFNPYAIEVDDAGSVYVLGQTPSDSLKMTDTVFSCAVNALHLVKLNNDGDFIWSRFTVPSFSGSYANNLLKYQSGKLYFQTTQLGLGSMDTSGQLLNTLNASYYLPSTAQTSIIFKNAVTFSNGDLLFVGQHRGFLAFGTDTFPLTSQEAAKDRYFYIRTTPALQLVWYKSYGSFMPKYRTPIGICIDPNDNIYTAAQPTFNEVIVFGNDTVENFDQVNGKSAFFKIDGNGNGIWIKDMQSGFSSTPHSVTWTDDNTGIYASGVYSGAATFGSFALNGNNDGKGYIVKLDANGNYTDAFSSAKPSVIPNALQAYPLCLSSNGSGKYYVSGMLSTLTNYVQSCTSYVHNRGFFLSQFTGIKDSVPVPTIKAIREGRKVYCSASIPADAQFVSWSFGDGSSTNVQVNPTHVYTTAGVFPLVLTTQKECLQRKDTVYILHKGIQKVLPAEIANNQLQMLFIKGGFPFSSTTGIQVKLKQGNSVITADYVALNDSSSLQGNFMLSNAPLGFYDVIVNGPGNFSDTLKNGIKMVPENNASLTLQISGAIFRLVNVYHKQQVIVTNPGNINQFGVPVYIIMHPKNQIRELANEVLTDSLGNVVRARSFTHDFTMAYDSLSNDSVILGVFVIPMVLANSSEVIEFTVRGTTLGNKPMYAVLGRPMYDSTQLELLDLRSSCDFFADPAACVYDLLGQIPALGCVGNVGSMGCSIGNLGRDAVGNRNKSGNTTKYIGDVFNFVADLAGTLGCEMGGDYDKIVKDELMTTVVNQTFGIAGAGITDQTQNIPLGIPGGFNIPGACVDAFRKGGALGEFKSLDDFVSQPWLFKDVASMDPNDKIGPIGITSENYFNGENVMHYRIRFENVDTATASAVQVIITDTLDASFYDISSLRFTGFGFADSSYQILNANESYAQEMDLRPAKNAILRFEATVDTLSNSILWKFYTLHPTTRELVNTITDGFLNPNVTSPEGEGFVSYSIAPKPNRPHLQQVSNKATIVFDENAPIVTDAWINTVDKQKPASQVNSLPAILNDTVFYIGWTGNDAHSGIDAYDIFVTVNDTATYLVQNRTRLDSAGIIGKFGYTYKFYSRAIDHSGNIEDLPTQPDAVVTLQQPVSVNELKDVTVSLVPNPATETVSIIFSEPVVEETELTVTGINGKVELKTTLQAGESRKTINLVNIPAGVHLVTLKNTRQSVVKMFVRQ